MLLDAVLTTIDEVRLQSLIGAGVREGRSLDYKRELPGGSLKERKEFLADVTSFANTSGGDILFGMDEERDGTRHTGVPRELVGLEAAALDHDIQRLENLVRDGVDPRISSVAFHPVSLDNGRIALLMRTWRSWSAPHAVTLEGTFRFFGRNSSGKYQLDVAELRAAFLRSDTIASKIRQFHTERLLRIQDIDFPTSVGDRPFVAVHVIPFGAFDGVLPALPLQHLHNDPRQFVPDDWPVQAPRFNADGVLHPVRFQDGTLRDYAQVFRSGIVEYVDAAVLSYDQSIPSQSFENAVTSMVTKALALLRRANVASPAVVLVSLVNVRGFRMGVDDRLAALARRYAEQTIDRPIVIAPDVLLDDFAAEELAPLLRPVFDTVWLAAGWPPPPHRF